MKAYTDIEQSKKLVEILPLESADMIYVHTIDIGGDWHYDIDFRNNQPLFEDDICVWSLAALLDILHSKVKDIPSLSGGGYKDGKYFSDWCLDYEFENGDYQKNVCRQSY